MGTVKRIENGSKKKGHRAMENWGRISITANIRNYCDLTPVTVLCLGIINNGIKRVGN